MVKRAVRWWCLAMLGCLVLSACSDDEGVPLRTPRPTRSGVVAATATPEPPATATPAPTHTSVPLTCEDPDVQASEPLCALDTAEFTCDFLVPETCLLPYPSSVFLAADATTATGFRVNYPREGMPANTGGAHIDPSEWNSLDGFSPGPIIEAFFPQGVDVAASTLPPITDFARSLETDSPTVLIEAETGERVMHFAEVDVRPVDPRRRMFLIRPGVRLKNATRYIVAIRGLIDVDGQPVPPPRAFQILRDGLETPVRTIDARRAAMEDIFSRLETAGVERETLLLAWDFVTASSASLTGRALAMRDQGLAANGPGAPPFEVTSVEDNYSDRIFRRVRGTYTVPLFMQSATPPTRYNLDANGVPVQNGTTTAPFTVTIPRIAVEGETPQPGRPIVYGHGLFGTGQGEVTAGNLQTLSNRFNFILAATDWIGMSSADLEPTILLIRDLSGFPALPDRLQQAMLNFILLSRLMGAANGFNSHAAFQFDGVPIIDTAEVYFYGISQGGIEGGTYMALATETVRGILGVGAANYSILLQRSADFPMFETVLNLNYTDVLDRQLMFPLFQQLWDRADPQGYLPHLVRDPLPGTPAKKVLLQVGVNDSQVPNIGTEIQVRSLGIPALAPSAYPLFQVPELEAPFDGSAFVPYDVNGTAAPLTNTPPEDDNGVHEAVRRLDAAQRQIDAFLRPDGEVQNFCDGPCFFTGVPDVEER